MDAQVFEVGSQTGGLQLLEGSLATLLTAMTAAGSVQSTLALALLGEVGELVGTQNELLALGGITMTLYIGSVDIVLHCAVLHSLQETAFLLNLQEYLPSLLSQCIGQVLNIVRTGRGVNDTVEMALLLNQQLLVAGDTLGEIGRLLINAIKGSNYHRVNTTQGSTHRLGLRTQQVDVRVKQRLVIS